VKRRDFITLLGGAAVARLFAALAQAPAKRPRITFLGVSEPRPSAKVAEAFIDGMRALNYTEGRDFEMEYRWAQGYMERLPALAEELVRRGTDVIVVGNVQSAVALRDATRTIPIVSAMLDDPVPRSSERACGLADRAAGPAVFHATPNDSRGRVGDEIAHALRTARAHR
jgi:putative ABC transport system substrate-binding protein